MAGSRSKLIASVCTAKQPRSPSDWCLCRQTSTLAILLLLCAIASAQPQPVRRVLILYEVGTSYPAINSIDEGIGESLSESHQRIQYYREYMETGLFPEPADQKEVRDYLVRKYRNRRPDVIITAGPSPLKLVSDLHERFFSGVPIIFCVPNDAEKELSLGPEFTGVTGELKGAETIKAALGLLPRTKHIFVVGGASKYDVGQVAAVKNQLSPFQEQADISVLGDVEMSTLLDRLKHLPDQSIVLFTTLSKDATGTLYTSRETGPLVTTAANAPVFSLFDVYLNHGEVGGDLSSLLDQGRVAGAMARKVLDGAKPADIPRSVAVNRFTFDWKALKRWSLDEKMLPAGSIVVNRQLTVWQIYKWYIIAGIAIILLQTLLISALLSQSIRRRMIEGDLAVIHERLRLAVQVGKAVGWDWDIVSGRNRWFGDLQTIFGKGSDTHEAAGDDFFRYVHPDHRHLVSTAVAYSRDERKPYEAEFRIVRKDGAVRWLAARGSFYYSEQGVPQRMIGMAMDVSERKEAELKLQESEQRFRLLANTAPVMIWTTGVDGLCDYVNRPWLEFTGTKMESELGNGWAKSIHPEDGDLCLETYLKAFDRREPFEMEYRLRHHDGEYRWVLDKGSPRHALDGSFIGYIGSCIDITDRKAAHDALSSLSGELIAAQEEERSRIAREIHDDYQQRLALLANHIDGVREQVGDPATEVSQRLRGLWNEVSELAADLHSLSHNLHSSTLETLGLVAGIRAFCTEFNSQQELQIRFTHSDVPRDVPADVALCLFRVTQEALRNVKRHSSADRAEVMLEWTSKKVHLSVSDRGSGFDTRSHSPQSGIGIRSMEERLRLVGGRLEVRSRPSEGTTIDAWVPFKASNSHAAG